MLFCGMARTTAQIKALIVAAIQADTTLSVELTSPSAVAIWNLFAFVVAQSINILEQLVDLFKVDIEEIALRSYYGTSLWWKQQMLKFQYSATNPQVIQIINNVIGYPIVNTDLNLITTCSITRSEGAIIIKTAQGAIGAYFPLTSLMLTAAQNYAEAIMPSGETPTVISINADKLYIQADIYFLGQFVSTAVKANVILAINTYLSDIDFNGTIFVAKIQDAIQGVLGVKDVVIKNITARSDAQTIATGTNLVLNGTVTNASRLYSTFAGYIIGETTASFTLNDTLTMIAE